ncbi:cold-shock protein [Williamsia herbipolensis]|uniref:cold-shock protein n=1 Tax=Williamsia herbipolensis TaxID=1603258 RepID=UPI0005F7A79C|nr:cold shock domain-containing protein [Williamsia herbipolensis]
MTSSGVIRVWHHDEGWGVIDSPDTPGGCRADAGAVMVEGVRTDDGMLFMGLLEGEPVSFMWGPIRWDDDEFSVAATAVWPSRCEPPATLPSGAFQTSLWSSAGRRGEFTVFVQQDPADLPAPPPRAPLPRTVGTVRSWNADEGWGVLDAPEAPGGAWVHFSEIRGMTGFRVLEVGARVEFAWEAARQDGFDYRAEDVDVIETPAT